MAQAQPVVGKWWLKVLKQFLSLSDRSRRQRPTRRYHYKPEFETLEDRWVPSPITKISDIGTASSDFQGGNVLTITVGAGGVGAGHSIIVECVSSNNGGINPAVTDSAGNIYQVDNIRNGVNGLLTV